jgi:hypothetical protein
VSVPPASLPADLGTTDGRIVIDNSAPPLDGDRYTLESVVRPVPPPALAAIFPAQFEIGAPDATLHAFGNGFNQDSRIVIAGNVERTTFRSSSELTTMIESRVWTNPDPDVPVLVRTYSGDSDPQSLAIVAADPGAPAPEPDPEPEPEPEPEP